MVRITAMLKKIITRLTTTITGGAILIAFFSVVSKIVGLLRDRLLATYFGAGDTLDVYYAAFKLPDLVFNTLVLGALSAAFIPVFVQVWSISKQKAFELANGVLTLLLGVVILGSVLIYIWTPELVQLIAPGFDHIKSTQTVELTRIMFLGVIFFTFSNIVSGILQARKKFTMYAIAPVMYNLGIIVGIVGLYPYFGQNGLAWGVVLGSMLHWLVQVPTVRQLGWRWHLVITKPTYETIKVIRLMLPRTLALGAGQISQLAMVMIASTLLAGSVSIYNLAFNLQSLNIIGISLAISSFPILSEAAAHGDIQKIRSLFSLQARRILYVMIPLSLGLFLLRAQLVRLVLGAGAFDWTATIETAATLGYFGLSLFAQSLVPLVTRVFYALEDTKTPVWISLVTVGFHILLAIILKDSIGVAGLALAFSISVIVQVIVLMVLLHRKIHGIDIKTVLISASRSIGMAGLTGVFVYATLYAIAPLVDMQTGLGIFIQSVSALSIGVLVYGSLSIALEVQEIAGLAVLVKKRLRFLKN